MRALVQQTLRRFGVELKRKSPNPFDVQRQAIDRPSPVIFDVGAYVGEVTNIYRGLFPGAQIHAFEPFQPSFEKLERNTAAHRQDTHLVRMALSDQPGRCMLHANEFAPTNSLLQADRQAGEFWNAELMQLRDRVNVEVSTIDRYCLEQKISTIDILKLDVQGNEYRSLQGAQGLLASQAIALVYLEVITAPTYAGQHKLHEYFQLFDDYGYELVDIYQPLRKDTRLLQADVLFSTTAARQTLMAA